MLSARVNMTGMSDEQPTRSAAVEFWNSLNESERALLSDGNQAKRDENLWRKLTEAGMVSGTQSNPESHAVTQAKTGESPRSASIVTQSDLGPGFVFAVELQRIIDGGGTGDVGI